MSFARNAGDIRDSFSHYYVPNGEIKYFNVLIDGKSFFFLFSDLSKQTKLKYPHHISFIGKLENQAPGATMFFSLKNQKKQLLIIHKTLSQSNK